MHGHERNTKILLLLLLLLHVPMVKSVLVSGRGALARLWSGRLLRVAGPAALALSTLGSLLLDPVELTDEAGLMPK